MVIGKKYRGKTELTEKIFLLLVNIGTYSIINKYKNINIFTHLLLFHLHFKQCFYCTLLYYFTVFYCTQFCLLISHKCINF